MFGIGMTEFIVIAFFLLIFVGPKHLPDLISKVTYVIRQMQNASRDLRNQIDIELADINKTKSDIEQSLIKNADRLYGVVEETTDEIKEIKDDLKKTGHESGINIKNK
jgi:Tat protein translocase TatB subunit